MLDSGNALFQVPGQKDDASLRRAELILSTMGQLGTIAMAVGQRDLNWGHRALKANAEKAKVKVLSANLLGDDGKPLFPASTIAHTEIASIGVIGVSPVGVSPTVPGVRGEPVVPAVLAEAKRLKGKVDALVVLAAIPYADALASSRRPRSAG